MQYSLVECLYFSLPWKDISSLSFVTSFLIASISSLTALHRAIYQYSYVPHTYSDHHADIVIIDKDKSCKSYSALHNSLKVARLKDYLLNYYNELVLPIAELMKLSPTVFSSECRCSFSVCKRASKNDWKPRLALPQVFSELIDKTFFLNIINIIVENNRHLRTVDIVSRKAHHVFTLSVLA